MLCVQQTPVLKCAYEEGNKYLILHCLLRWREGGRDGVGRKRRQWQQQQYVRLPACLTLMEQLARSTGNLHWLCHWYYLVPYLLLVA